MDDFYDFIVNVTKASSYQNILIKDSQVVYDTIMKNYRTNIKLAASEGRNESYICIYNSTAKINNVVPIDSYVRMNNPKLKEKFEEFKMETVLEKIQKNINPFKVEVRKLNNLSNNDVEIFGIIIIWETNL